MAYRDTLRMEFDPGLPVFYKKPGTSPISQLVQKLPSTRLQSADKAIYHHLRAIYHHFITIKIFHIITTVLAVISCVAATPIASDHSSLASHTSSTTRSSTADENTSVTTKNGAMATWLEKVNHAITIPMPRTFIFERRGHKNKSTGKGQKKAGKAAAVKEELPSFGFDGRSCWMSKQMGEVLPDECLNEDREMYKSNTASNPEKAEADSERWNNLLHGPVEG